ncbi:MAG: undecaprenyl-phosphate alpha-N-acetylglucosaminyl 1-phosphate transferase [Nevskiales bacterium]
MRTVAIVLFTAGLSGLLCEGTRRMALWTNVLDVPNRRSSHQVPTPRGGGIAIAIAAIFGVWLFWRNGQVPLWLLYGICLPGAAIAMVGLYDDIRRLSARSRLVVHTLACASGWLLLPMGIFSEAEAFGPTRLLEGAVVVTAMIWAVNLYNFMDGIDGLAGVEALFAGTALFGLTALAGNLDAGLPAAAIAASAIGFLALNWPPAKLFMGDSGSGFLGYVLGYAGLAAVLAGVSVWSVIIVVGAFVIDATVTLVIRLLQGQRAYQAHRSHAYQHLADRWGSHRPVTILLAGLNFFWLAPLAILVEIWPHFGPWITAFAYLPLVYGAIRVGAGKPDGAE